MGCGLTCGCLWLEPRGPVSLQPRAGGGRGHEPRQRRHLRRPCRGARARPRESYAARSLPRPGHPCPRLTQQLLPVPVPRPPSRRSTTKTTCRVREAAAPPTGFTRGRRTARSRRAHGLLPRRLLLQLGCARVRRTTCSPPPRKRSLRHRCPREVERAAAWNGSSCHKDAAITAAFASLCMIVRSCVCICRYTRVRVYPWCFF